MNIILASGSPRRHEILESAGIPHRVAPAGADETLPDGITPRDAVATLSRRKAEAGAAEQNPVPGETLIVAADTLVACDGEIFGKPRDREDALRMLRALAGGTHSVLTGVTVTDGERYVTAVEETAVHMRRMTDGELLAYIDTAQPYDKAGAYGIQEAAGLFVTGIEGDFSNVVGLPLCRTGLLLEEMGYKLFG